MAADGVAGIEGERGLLFGLLLDCFQQQENLLCVRAVPAQFPSFYWRTNSNSVFAEMWLAYTVSFELVLAQWEDGDWHETRPSFIAQPVSGLLQTIKWSEQCAERKQSELIGMTAEAEVDVGALAGYIAAAPARGEEEGGELAEPQDET